MGPLALGRRASARPCRSPRLTTALVCSDPFGSIWVGLVKETVKHCFSYRILRTECYVPWHCQMPQSSPTPFPQVTLTSEVKRGKKIPDPIIKFLQVQRKNKHPEQLCFDFCRSFQTFSKAHRNQSVARSLGYTR